MRATVFATRYNQAMIKFLTHIVVTAISLGIAEWILAGVHIDSIVTLLVAALVLGFVNAVIRPVLVVLTLPITLLTLGVFYFVVNGLVFWLAAGVVPGFRVDSLGWAMGGAIVVGAISCFFGIFSRDGGDGERRP